MAEPRALATRVLLAVLTILLLGSVLVAGSTWWNGRLAARQAYDRILLGAANDIAESIRVQDGAPLVALPVSAFELLAQAPEDRVYYAVHGPGGELITGLDPQSQIVPPEQGHAVFFDAALDGEAARFVTVQRRFAERDFSGSVEVIVGQTLRARTGMAQSLTLDALRPMALAGAALLLIAWAVVRRALRPLEAITENLARRDPYDLTAIPAEDLPRELQVMLSAMNRFMGRLDGQVDAMRTLISDTAHQLRTPVAAIRIQAETAVVETEPPLRERALDRLLRRTRSLGTLLDQLLSRALVVHRTDSAPRVEVDLREVALEIVERDDHALLAPGVELKLEIGEHPVLVQADAFSLGEAARNLLVNALKHGQAPVSVGAERRGPEAILWVRDSGPGPSDAVRARMGVRFNRSAGSGESGSGIGLSIVSAVATAFGGRMDLSQDAGGFRIALVLPVTEARS
ncbi:sensor histidine kinase [Palleronia caenipelagi]|uniref:histidine kinase n=1 Tax=Palleronia caenipelagi TaxID=2489174 RepID=A0A547PP03_9RHOB|nr:sensor histidine kinase [Palleronia caenipelagi]TRD15876.1 HAMP domain-containing protein [Palleronia caenipelagi]